MSQLELTFDGPFIVRLTIEDGFDLFRKHYWDALPKGKTTRRCFRRIAIFFGSRHIRFVDEIGKQEVAGMRAYLASIGLKANTINTHHRILTRFYNWLYEVKESGDPIDLSKITLPLKNPGPMVPQADERPFQRGVAWPKRVVWKLIAAAQRLGDEDLSDIIYMLYVTKLRLSDLWKMTPENVFLEHGYIMGIQSKSIKSKMPSGLPYKRPITPRSREILKRRLRDAKPLEAIFRDKDCSLEAWEQRISRRFKLARSFANLSHVQLRDFRPSAATLELDNGVDPQTVSEGLGHTSLRMLPVYARRSLIHQRKAAELLEDEESEIIF